MARRKRVNWPVIGAVFIGLLMVGSIVGFIAGPMGYGSSLTNAQTYHINGVTVTQTATGYQANQGGTGVTFTYDPISANTTAMPQAALDALTTDRYFIFTSNATSIAAQDIALAQYQISQVLATRFGAQSAVAFTTPFNTYPVATCANASAYAPVIEFRDGNETAIRSEGSCIVLEAQSPLAYTQLRDRVLYGVLGVLPGQQ